MKPEPDYGKDELLSALEDLLQSKPDDVGGLTFQELLDQGGLGTAQLRKTLHQLKNQGRLESVRVRRQALDGTYRPVPAYRLKSLPPDST